MDIQLDVSPLAVPYYRLYLATASICSVSGGEDAASSLRHIPERYVGRAKCVVQQLAAMRPTGRDSQNNDNILSSAHETLGDATDDQTRTHEAVGAEATTTAEEEGNPPLHGLGSKGTLAGISSMIDDNLRLFRRVPTTTNTWMGAFCFAKLTRLELERIILL